MIFKAVLANFVLLVLLTLPAQADSIVLAADSWCPYVCDREDGELEGYIVDIVREIFEPAGYDVEYRLMVWERAVEDAYNGRLDGVMGAAPEEAEGMVFPAEEIADGPFAFYVQKGSTWRFRSLNDLIGKRIGLSAGYFMDPEMVEFFEAHNDEITVVYARGDYPAAENVKRLAAGRVDVILDDESVLCYTADSLGLKDEIQYAGDDGFYVKMYVALSPLNPMSAQYAVLLSQGVRSLRKTGRLNEILAKYGLSDWRGRPRKSVAESALGSSTICLP